ncbi:MAG: DUF2971 domain-containing protein [Sulfuricurvum sp.]|nr:DUF2971 domain-containing protein [Sulfuricurvum sp.]
MANRFYRFRSLKSIFEFEELQKQEIYFASTEQLNDPMEGYRDIFWSGDEIVWMNLFKHYLLCLERVSQLLVLGGEEYGTIDENNIPIFSGFDDFPTPMYKELFETIASEFLTLSSDLIVKIATRSTPIRRDELHLYLNSVHFLAIQIIQKHYEKSELLPKQVSPTNPTGNSLETTIALIDNIEKDIVENGDKNNNDLMCEIVKNMHIEIMLINKLGELKNTQNRNFVLIEFPEKYINSLEKIMYSKWYASCFMSEESTHNSSVWGHYSDSHQGICLIFEANENNLINLHGKTGWSSSKNNPEPIPSFGNINHPFHKINYKDGFEPVDFWKFLGRLPVGKLHSTWFLGDDKSSNIAAKYLSNNEKKWRENYWDIFYRGITVKTKDWKYENEYRLILTSLLDDEIDEKFRKLKYDFKSLKGLIFGIKMPEKDKIKIIEIIGQKCKENNITDFEFYQAYYSHKDQNIQYRKLSFLKF